mmetsp:Transcript_24260/g.75490  ORF Transcript_24260/g.75490 Transcript_24260/m.75490 type:complete len:262 (+) Transcript_24260:270-1055(+)
MGTGGGKPASHGTSWSSISNFLLGLGAAHAVGGVPPVRKPVATRARLTSSARPRSQKSCRRSSLPISQARTNAHLPLPSCINGLAPASSKTWAASMVLCTHRPARLSSPSKCTNCSCHVGVGGAEHRIARGVLPSISASSTPAPYSRRRRRTCAQQPNRTAQHKGVSMAWSKKGRLAASGSSWRTTRTVSGARVRSARISGGKGALRGAPGGLHDLRRRGGLGVLGTIVGRAWRWLLGGVTSRSAHTGVSRRPMSSSKSSL